MSGRNFLSGFWRALPLHTDIGIIHRAVAKIITVIVVLSIMKRKATQKIHNKQVTLFQPPQAHQEETVNGTDC